MNPLAKASGTPIFDPTGHEGNLLQAFQNYLDSWEMWYDVACLNDLSADASAAQRNEHKAKVFRMCAFQGEKLTTDLKSEYNQDISALKLASFDDMITKIQNCYKPTQNQVLLHYQFHQLKQHPGEKIDAFINRVQLHADQCAFKCQNQGCTDKNAIHNSLIRDQILIGTNMPLLRTTALDKEHDLQALISHSRKLEATEEATKLIDGDAPTSSIAINSIENDISLYAEANKIGKQGGKYSQKFQRKQSQADPVRPTTGSNKILCCAGCGRNNCDRGSKCIARNAFCKACGRKGHFSTVCLSTKGEISTVSAINATPPKQIHTITESPRKANLSIGQHQIEALIDTGAEVNILLEHEVPSYIKRIFRTPITLQPYGSKIITPKGQITLDTTWGNNTKKATWIVVDKMDLKGNPSNLLSCKLAESLGIITFHSPQSSIHAISTQNTAFQSLQKAVTPDIADILSKYSPVFDGLGKLNSDPVTLHLDPDAKPVIQPPRPIPFHLQQEFNKVIASMEQEDVIEQHYGPVTWLSNPVLVPKPDGGIRITVDLRSLNKALKNPHLPIPRVEDIMAMFNGKSTFTKLDLKTAFHQLELSSESRPLTVFCAGDRLMRYKRLTMGTLPASGELNKRLRPILASIPNAAIIQDDIVIAAPDIESHNKALADVLEALHLAGLTVSPQKCIIASQEIPFWGFQVTKDGIKPDPQKAESVKNAGRPQTKDELRSFLCMIRSNGQFIPDLATATASLRDLTKESSNFQWSDQHEREFQYVKQAFHKDILLQHFDTTKPTFIFVDAHQTGLSAILTQGASISATKAVAVASRTTTDTEKKYSQLDLEASAVDFGLRQFRHLLVGGPSVQVVTDHQPLVSLWKSRRKLSSRIERILLRHQDIDHHVVWQKGKTNPADYLSRHATPIERLPVQIAAEAKEHQKLLFLLHQPVTSTISKDCIQKAQANDRQLELLRHFIAIGQPPRNDPTLKLFFKIFHELSIGADDIIYRGDQFVLPASLHHEAITATHSSSHAGQSAVKRRLRAHFWFPGLDEAVRLHIESCHHCQVHSTSPTKVPLSSTPVPKHPWDSVSLDLFGPLPDHSHALVSWCNLSRFPAAKLIKSTRAEHVLPALASIYNNFGNPKEHKADNGPPFNSKDFKDFSDQRGIYTKHSYPYHPQGNEAECFMKPLGKAIKTALDTQKLVQQAIDDLLTDYRSTPHVATRIAPGDMLLRGGYRSGIISTRKPPTNSSIEEARQRDKKRKDRNNSTVNSSRWRQYPTISQGNEVLILRSGDKRKFQSRYEQIPYTVIDIQGTRYELLASDPKHRKQPIFRHASQIKLYQEPALPFPELPRQSVSTESMHFKDTCLPYKERRWNDKKENGPLTGNSATASNTSLEDSMTNNMPEVEMNHEPSITFCNPVEEHIEERRRSKHKQREKKNT